MLDYLVQIKPLEDDGMSDADIASLLAASTNKDISIAELENFLDFEGLAKRDALSGSWVGVLPDEVTNNNFGLGPALGKLFSHMNKPRSVIVDTTVSPWATDAADLTAGLVSAGLLTPSQQADFYALGGGLPNTDLTEADVTQSRVDWQAQEEATAQELAKIETLNQFWLRFNEKWNQYVQPAIEGGASVGDAEIVSGLQAIVNSWND